MRELPAIFIERSRQGGRDDSDHHEGRDFFRNLDEVGRLELTTHLVAAHMDWETVNDAAVGGALREAWHSEPCTGGRRLGSYLSAVAQAAPEETIWHPGEIVLERGEDMMTREERSLLEGLTYPLTVHRGGVGDATLIALGVSWTTDIEVARFYAHVWPRRGGFREPGRVLSMRIERHEAVAIFTDRSEAELLVPEGIPRDREFEVAEEGQKPRAFRFVIREPEPGSQRRLYVEPVPTD